MLFSSKTCVPSPDLFPFITQAPQCLMLPRKPSASGITSWKTQEICLVPKAQEKQQASKQLSTEQQKEPKTHLSSWAPLCTAQRAAEPWRRMSQEPPRRFKTNHKDFFAEQGEAFRSCFQLFGRSAPFQLPNSPLLLLTSPGPKAKAPKQRAAGHSGATQALRSHHGTADVDKHPGITRPAAPPPLSPAKPRPSSQRSPSSPGATLSV